MALFKYKFAYLRNIGSPQGRKEDDKEAISNSTSLDDNHNSKKVLGFPVAAPGLANL